MSDPDFDALLPSFLDLGLLPPATGVEERTRRRVRATLGDFAGHVPYVPGEDLRYLDWHALARCGERVLRSYDEAQHRRLELVVDATASTRTRFAGLQRLAKLYAYLALQRLDSLRLVSFSGAGVHAEDYEGAEAWRRVRDRIDGLRPQGRSHLDLLGPELLGERRSGIVLLSDFEPIQEVRSLLLHLTESSLQLVCLFPRTRVEAGLERPLGGRTRIVDQETGRVLEVVIDSRLADAFASEQRAWEAELSRALPRARPRVPRRDAARTGGDLARCELDRLSRTIAEDGVSLEFADPRWLWLLLLLPIIWILIREPARILASDRVGLWEAALHRVGRRKSRASLRRCVALLACLVLGSCCGPAAALGSRGLQGARPRLRCLGIDVDS